MFDPKWVLPGPKAERIKKKLQGPDLQIQIFFICKGKALGNGGEGEPREELGASQPTESFPCKTEWLVKILT